MGRNYTIAVLAVAVLSAVCLIGCQGTPDASASAGGECPSGAKADAATGTDAATCEMAAEDCPGTCPSMKGTKLADANAKTSARKADCTRPRSGDDVACEDGCTCPAHEGSDADGKCPHAAKDADGNVTCESAARDVDGNATCGCDHAAEKTGSGECKMSEGTAKTCPQMSEPESS